MGEQFRLIDHHRKVRFVFVMIDAQHPTTISKDMLENAKLGLLCGG